MQDCVIYIEQPSQKVTKNLLSFCQTICQVQLISDLFVNKVSGRHRTEDDTFVMSRDAQTVWIQQWNFTLNFWQYFLSSLSVTRNITTLDLSHVILGNSGRHLSTSVQAWRPSSHLKTFILCNVSITVPDWGKLCESLVVCQNLTHLDLSQNILGQSGLQLACSVQSWGFHLEIANFEGCCLKLMLPGILLNTCPDVKTSKSWIYQAILSQGAYPACWKVPQETNIFQIDKSLTSQTVVTVN